MRTPLKTNLPIILLIGAIGVQTFTSCSTDDILGGDSSSSGGSSSSSDPSSSSTPSSSSSSSSSSSGIPIGGWRTCTQISERSEQCSDNAYAEYDACLEENNYDDTCYSDYYSKWFGCSFFGVACNGISAVSCMEHYKSADCFDGIFPDGGDKGDYCHIEYEYDDGGSYKECLLIGEDALIYSAKVCKDVRGGEVNTYSQCKANYVYIDNTLDGGDMGGSYCHYRNDCDLIGGIHTASEEDCLSDHEDGEVITYLQCKNKGAKIYNETGEEGEEW